MDPEQGGGNLLDQLGSLLAGIFGGGGSSERPGYEWDALQGWVPTAGKDNAGMMQAAQGALSHPDPISAPARPVPAAPAAMPKTALPAPNKGIANQPYDLPPVSVSPDMLTQAPSGKSPQKFR